MATLAKQYVADQSIEQAQGLKQQIENARQGSINQLYQTADPAGAARTAIGTASQFQRPSVFAPIGNAFANAISQYQTNRLIDTYRQNAASAASYDARPLSAPLGSITLGGRR